MTTTNTVILLRRQLSLRFLLLLLRLLSLLLFGHCHAHHCYDNHYHDSCHFAVTTAVATSNALILPFVVLLLLWRHKSIGRPASRACSSHVGEDASVAKTSRGRAVPAKAYYLRNVREITLELTRFRTSATWNMHYFWANRHPQECESRKGLHAHPEGSKQPNVGIIRGVPKTRGTILGSPW